MRRTYQSAALMLLLTLALFAGCAPSSGVAQNPDAAMETNRIVVQGMNPTVSVSAVKARVRRLESGHLQVQAQLVREVFDSEFVELKVFFRDSDGFNVEETNWQPVNLERDVVTQFDVTSLSTEAADFRMVIRSMD